MERKSEQLKKEYEEEDNDLRAMGKGTKLMREQREERFREKVLPSLGKLYTVNHDNNGKYSVITERHGTIDVFPRANKLLVRNKNAWHKPAVRWIMQNLLTIQMNNPLKNARIICDPVPDEEVSLHRQLVEHAKKSFTTQALTLATAVVYENAGTWWTGFIFWDWGQQLVARYITWKAQRKLNRYYEFLKAAKG